MIKLVSGGQAMVKFPIKTTPDELREIATRLEESAKFCAPHQRAELEVWKGDFILCFEHYPEKSTYQTSTLGVSNTPGLLVAPTAIPHEVQL